MVRQEQHKSNMPFSPLARLLWKSASIAANSGKSSTPGRGATLAPPPARRVLGKVASEKADGLADSTKGPRTVLALDGLGLASRMGLVSPRGGDSRPLLGLLFLLDLNTHILAERPS